MESEGNISEIWTNQRLPIFKIAYVECDENYPKEYLKSYLERDILNRDSQFYLCLRTQRPQLWIDLYQKEKRAFDPKTKRGFDADFVMMQHDYKLANVLRHTPIDVAQHVTNFSLTFHSRKEAHQFSELLEVFTPYMHRALLRAFGCIGDGPLCSIPLMLSLREREVLKWLIEGKSNGEVGAVLKISERTVKFHVQNLMRKFGAMNRPQLIANAFGQLHGTSTAIDG
jgi:DNA-binding CsgD family transcriptional regulator